MYRPFDGAYSYAESLDGINFVKPGLGLVRNLTIWSRWDNKVGLGDRIDIPGDSNLLPIGMLPFNDTTTRP